MTSWRPCWCTLNKRNLVFSFVWDTNMAATLIVFCVSWECVKMLYNVGSTSTAFKVRFRNHKSAIKTNKKTCEVAIHFNRSLHNFLDLEFIGIEAIYSNTNTDSILLSREAFWSSQLCTLSPHGLNKRQEFNSKKRIRYNR